MKSWRIRTEKRNTEKKYWCNGLQVRGKDFYSYAASFRNKAFMFSFSWSSRYMSFSFYNLI